MLEALWKAILAKNPRHRSFLEAAVAGLDEAERRELVALVAWARAEGFSIERLAAGYNTMVLDTLREQFFFNRHGRYRYSRFEQVATRVYHDPDYMERYMLGLALSSFLWPNHAAMRRHFEATLPRDRGGTYLEVGPGHGYLLMRALELAGFDRYVGVDLSATSIALTRSVLTHFQPAPTALVELRCADFLEDPLEGPVAALVIGEVLEHVERPDRFLARIRALADADTFIHLTTCLNAPAIDHITLFEHRGQLEALFEDAGLVVEDRLLLPHSGTSLDESERRRLPVNVAYVLRSAA